MALCSRIFGLGLGLECSHVFLGERKLMPFLPTIIEADTMDDWWTANNPWGRLEVGVKKQKVGLSK